MDELKITSEFTRKMVSKIIARKLKKKIGYDIDIQLTSLNVVVVDGRAKVDVNLHAEMNNEDLDKFLFKLIK